MVQPKPNTPHSPSVISISPILNSVLFSLICLGCKLEYPGKLLKIPKPGLYPRPVISESLCRWNRGMSIFSSSPCNSTCSQGENQYPHCCSYVQFCSSSINDSTEVRSEVSKVTHMVIFLPVEQSFRIS